MNQDALENQFSSVRYMGGSNSHPTASLFCDRISMLCVSKNIKIVLENSAVELEGEQDENTISADLLDEGIRKKRYGNKRYQEKKVNYLKGVE